MYTAQDYWDLFDSCVLTTDPTRVLEMRQVCKVMLANQLTYWGVGKSTDVPWLVIAAIHYRESSQSFKCHLHNGDPLTERTVHVPAGRPEQGEPPFTWSASAIDALHDRQHPDNWDVAGALRFCEGYNGLGYQNHGQMSPYIWSYTDKYNGGLYIADGTLDMTRKDPRPGVAALFKTLSDLGVSLDFEMDVAPNATLH